VLVPACVLMPLVWLALLLAAPAAAFGVPASGLTYALGSIICHQRPDRSFDLFAAQMPVCARCVGLYAGAATGAFMAVVVGWRWTPSACSDQGRGTGRCRAALLAAAVPTVAIWVVEGIGMAAPSNLVRAVAALPPGAVVAWIVIDAARGSETVISGTHRRVTLTCQRALPFVSRQSPLAGWRSIFWRAPRA
jgi:hypothetical protein